MHTLYVQLNLSDTDTLGADILSHFLLQYRGFPLSDVKNVLVTSVGTKIFVLIMEVFKPGARQPQAGTGLVSYNHFHCGNVCVCVCVCTPPRP